jgi:hypothetical protein
MVASRGGVALQKIKISQKLLGFEKLLLVGGIATLKGISGFTTIGETGSPIETGLVLTHRLFQ